jgi:putative nucleotidyltransferase with HDIG domain
MAEAVPENLAVLVERVDNVSPLPSIVGQMLNVCGDRSASARKVANVVGRDLALAARVVRTANSAYYGTGREIRDIPGAVVRLGMSAIRNIVVGMNVAELYEGPTDPETGFSRDQLWTHSVAVSLLSDIISRRSKLAGTTQLAGEAFLVGLLHDIGVVLVDEHGRDACTELPWASRESDESLARAERRVLGFDHQALGAAVLEKWQFPEVICQAVGAHHRPASSAHNPLVQIVALAEILAADRRMGYCDIPRAADSVLEGRLRALNISRYESQKIAEETVEKLPDALEVFSGSR